MKYQHITHEYLKWELADLPHYKWSEKGKLFNTKTGREIKRVYNGGSIGYCIDGKFMTLAKLRMKLSKITKLALPF